MHEDPAEAELIALASRADDAPLIAPNLNRYRERADYPDGTPDADVSGREACMRYGPPAIEQASVLLFTARPEPKLDSAFGA